MMRKTAILLSLAAYSGVAEFTPANHDELYDAVTMWFGNNAKAREQYGLLKDWNTGKVESFAHLFRGRKRLDETHKPEEDISNWDTSRVTDMTGVFMMCEKFNADISKWDVSKVTTMEDMFHGAHDFNRSIGKWDVSKVKNFNGMFRHAHDFHQELDTWDTSSAENMAFMFYDCHDFDAHLGSWDVSKVTDMNSMFYHSMNFHQDIGKWNVAKVKDMDNMFEACSSFNYTYILDTWNFESLPKNADGTPRKPKIQGDYYDPENGHHGYKQGHGQYRSYFKDQKKEKRAQQRAGKAWDELSAEL